MFIDNLILESSVDYSTTVNAQLQITLRAIGIEGSCVLKPKSQSHLLSFAAKRV